MNLLQEYMQKTGRKEEMNKTIIPSIAKRNPSN
jgi:hypothetical protein